MQSQRVGHNWVTFTFIFRAALVAQLVKNLLQCRRPLFDSWVRKTCWRRDRPTHSSILGLLWWLSWWRIYVQGTRPGFDPWVGKIPWEGKGYPLQYSGLENSMDCIVHGVLKDSDTTEWLSLSLLILCLKQVLYNLNSLFSCFFVEILLTFIDWIC